MKLVRLSFIAILGLIAARTTFAEPKITAVDGGLRAEGISAGGSAVWFGGTIDEYGLARRLTRHAVITADEDGDGAVSFALNPGRHYVLLIVVDIATGEYATYRSEGVEVTELDLRGNNWRSGLAELDLASDYLEFLLVRPGDGAWVKRAIEGGTADGDRTPNGRLRLVVNVMQPLQKSQRPPGGVRRGDLLVIVNPQTLESVIRPAKD